MNILWWGALISLLIILLGASFLLGVLWYGNESLRAERDGAPYAHRVSGIESPVDLKAWRERDAEIVRDK